MGEWLLGVYKGNLITAKKEDAPEVIGYNHLDETLVSGAEFNRSNIRPCFFILQPVADGTFVWGDKKLLEKYELEHIAYKDGRISPIQAYGRAQGDCFILDNKYLTKRLVFELESHFAQGQVVCILALKTRGLWVRTGTFFTVDIKGRELVFRPCKREKKYLVGKGVLLGIRAYSSRIGTTSRREAENEKLCPVSKSCVRFQNGGLNIFHRGQFFIVYREVSTDLRADMPLALLKISQIDGAFEALFKRLGESLRREYVEFGCVRTTAYARDIQLDGVVVDYARPIDKHTAKNAKTLESLKGAVRSLLFFTALVSVHKKDALSAMARGRKGVERLVERTRGGLYSKYKSFFEKFVEGAEVARVNFEDLASEGNVANFFEYRKKGPFTRIGWWVARKIT